MSEQLTPNFKRSEFACRCGCGFDAVAPELVAGLQKLRDAIQKPVKILSGCRCARHNATVGGAPHSQHVLGKAADIRVAGMTAREIYGVAANIPEFCGFGVDDERGFAHVDIREKVARWCYRDGRAILWNDDGSAMGLRRFRS